MSMAFAVVTDDTVGLPDEPLFFLTAPSNGLAVSAPEIPNTMTSAPWLLGLTVTVIEVTVELAIAYHSEMRSRPEVSTDPLEVQVWLGELDTPVARLL
jgi:hypothetical protein